MKKLSRTQTELMDVFDLGTEASVMVEGNWVYRTAGGPAIATKNTLKSLEKWGLVEQEGRFHYQKVSLPKKESSGKCPNCGNEDIEYITYPACSPITLRRAARIIGKCFVIYCGYTWEATTQPSESSPSRRANEPKRLP